MKNKAKKRVKILSCATALMLTATMGLSTTLTFGAEKNIKDESVYVITNNDGSQKDVIVSDHLYNKTGSEILTDKSDLTNIENVKGKEKFTKDENGNIIWNADKKDVFYQGNSAKTAPVKMDVKYYLNDKEVSGDALKGKSGKVKIVVDFDNTTKVPFIAMTGFMAEDESMKNITVNSGKVIDDGEKQIVVGMAAPGLAENLGVPANKIGFSSEIVFEGEAKNFAVDSMMSIVTSDLFEDIDTGSLSGLNFDDQINLLDSSAKKLVEGSSTLYQGINYMNSQSQDLTAGVATLNKGAGDLSKELSKDLTAMKAGADSLKNGSSQVYGGVKQIQGLVNDNAATQTSGLATGAATLKTGLSTINSNSTEGEAYDTQALTLLEKYKDTMSQEDYNKMKEAILASKGIHSTIATTTAQDENLGDVAGEISEGMTEIQGALNGDGTKVNPGLVNGAYGVYNGAETLSGYLTDATAAKDSLTSGAGNLAAGMEQLNQKTGTLVAGVNKLDIGSQTLSKGMEQFYNQGIAKIVKLYNSNLKGIGSKINSTINAGKNYSTFTQLPDGSKGSVKFIYKTELSQ